VIRFLWALPVTVLGFLLASVGLLTGGRVHWVDVVLEQHNGLTGWCLGKIGHACITFGHVTLGATRKDLAFFRDHERVHTRQYGTWGVFLLPAYLVSSFWVWTHHQDPWADNWFEVQAIREAGI